MAEVEQITKEPDQKVERVKDPKKVAAGKRLTEYNRKAKQALQEKEERERGTPNEDNSSGISLGTALTLVSISLTALGLYFKWRAPAVEESKPCIPTPAEKPKPKASAVFGME